MKFYDVVGFSETTEEVPGVHKKVITERNYYGDVIKDTRRLEGGQSINDDITIGSSISIVAADVFANEQFHAMLYVKWRGVLWKIREVDDSQPPRLLLRLGGVYNGARAIPAPDPPDDP